MRKSAGLMIITLLLLAVPVLASAWSLTVKVTGPAAGNNVTLTGGATGAITSGTVYKYPTAATTATINTASGYTSSVMVDGVTNAGPVTFNSGSHSVTVVYTQSISP